MNQATVNGKDQYSVEVTSDRITIDGQVYSPDIRQIGERWYHCINGTGSYQVALLEADYARKLFVFDLRGQRVTVQLRNDLDLLVEKLGMAQAAEAVVREIAAPMPGLIVGLSVEAGQTIEDGDSVLTLEAMKMENVIKSPVSGTVEAVHVQVGDSVEKKQVLVSFKNV
jgi:acetyl/propionyl-CoA carboxylase alpha subunit